MKKMIGTKVKRTIAGQLAFATAMIFSLPGNMLAQQTQTITAPSIDDVIYSTTSFSVSATSSSGLAVKYGVAGPATVNSSGSLTMLGKGSVTVFFFQDGDADYYLAAPVVKSFTISGATATVDLADASAVYDGTGKSLTPTQTDTADAALNEPITVTYTDAGGNDVASPTNVGVYSATATITSASNYSGSDTATLTITQAVATVTISGISQTHDGSQKPVTVVTVPAGLSVTTTYTGGSYAPAAAVAAVDAVAATYEADGTTIKTAAVAAVAAVPAVTAPSDAGDYAVSVSVVDDNYSGSDSPTLTIGSVTIGNTAVTYTGAAQAPVVTVVPADLTHTVAYADSAGTAVASPTNAGTYTVLVTVSDARYPGDTSASYTIDTAPLTAAVGALSVSYSLGAPTSAEWAATLSYTGFVGSDGATDVDASGLTVSYDRAVSDGGVYVATPAGLSAGNYTIGYTDGALTVNKLSASVTLGNTTQGYTGAVLGVTASSSVEGLALTIVYRDSAGVLVASPTAQGTYYVTATVADANYEGSKTGTLTITKATTTLELDDLADVVYSTTPITLQSTVSGDRPVLYFVTGVASLSGSDITLAEAGTVRVTAYVAGTADYESAYVAKTFTVSKASVSVFMADADVVYTGSGQALSTTVTNESGTALTVEVDVVYKDASGNTVASPTDAGVYTVTATVNDNRYKGSATGALTILQAPLTVTADAQSKEYLQANPALTLTYTGFLISDDSSILTTQPIVGTAAAENSGLGNYGIVVYGAVAANYTIVHVDGTLTIEKNTVGITLTGTSQTYTGSGLAVTATPAMADVTVVVTYADSASAAVVSPTNAGTYSVTATLDDALYRGTQSGTLTIGKATADVTLGSLANTYDGTEKVASVTTTPSGLTVDVTYSQGSILVAPIAAVAAVAAVAEVLYVAGDTLPEGKVVGDVKTAAVAAVAAAAKVLYVAGDTLPEGKMVGDVKTAAVAAVAAVTGVTGPSDAGTYTVTATVDDANYEGSKVAILTISASDGQGSRSIQKGAVQPLTLAEMSNNPFSFSYETEKGNTYKVECSTDLIRWYEVDLGKGTGNEVKFTDKRQRLFRQQFYRVVLE